jgi:hypothetical protein
VHCRFGLCVTASEVTRFSVHCTGCNDRYFKFVARFNSPHPRNNYALSIVFFSSLNGLRGQSNFYFPISKSFLLLQLFFKLENKKSAARCLRLKNIQKLRQNATRLQNRDEARARTPARINFARPSRFCNFSFGRKNKISSENTLTKK